MNQFQDRARFPNNFPEVAPNPLSRPGGMPGTVHPCDITDGKSLPKFRPAS